MLYRLIVGLGLLSMTACNTGTPTTVHLDLENTPWDSIVAQASGQEVHFMMWQGSPMVNTYINDYVIPSVKKDYKIDLRVVSGQGPEIVQLLMREQQAQVDNGQVDIVWINGETFFQLRQIKGLWGPFVEALPCAQYIDLDNPFINTDFQQPVDGMECPWSLNQFVLVHDSMRLPEPPTTLASLSTFVKNHPGTFTISNDFSGMTLLKSFLVELAGDRSRLMGAFDEALYEELSQQLWQWINTHKAYFWQEGKTFPSEQTKMDQMFSSGELLLAYGFSEGSIDKKINQSLYSKATRAYPWAAGTIRNTNYLGVTYNSSVKAAALVVINFMLSPEAQWIKADPLGMDAHTVLDVERLDDPWPVRFDSIDQRSYGISMEALEPYAVQEPAPEYMIRLFEDFRTKVIEE